MHFEKAQLYHIYNQGNNRQKIFFNRDNYLFFLKKMRIHLLPYCDVLAYCLMPNHFHLLVKVNEVELVQPPMIKMLVDDTQDTHGVTQSHPVSKSITLNQSIAILLRSYTRAIHKQNGTSGALFREGTKAECLTQTNCITPSFYNSKYGAIIHIDNPEYQYPNVCFNYIHQNPVQAGLVGTASHWEYSSAPDYAELRKGTLVNKKVAKEYIEI